MTMLKEGIVSQLGRRGVLRGLAASGLALLAPSPARAVPAPVKTRLFMQETHVAGTAYYRAVDLEASLAPGQTLVLRRQPDNPHDPLAIEVLTASGDKLGYVPRAANPPYARLMDAGHVVNARIATVRPGKWD
ncbi:MAG: HIRAN domain-containing protein, partial [Alphaproteobacteria bacterium]|nr:HIRAN domain-containing protein [Alphaproteobacteria bacterium]